MENAPDRKRTLLVDGRPGMASFIGSYLAGEGYEVRHCSHLGVEVKEQVAEFEPDAMVIDLPGASLGFELLDVVRTDHDLAKLPVVVIAGNKDVARRALASYNVSRSITRPFDPEYLLEALREAMGQPPLHAELPEVQHDGVVGLAEYLLARHSRNLLLRWVQQLKEEPPWRDRPDLNFAELVDVTPLAVEALVSALHYRNPMRYFQDHPEAGERVSVHGKIRAEQGLSITSILREYALLRDQVWATLWSQMPRSVSTPDVINLQRLVHSTLDYISEYSVAAYLGAEPPRPSDFQGSGIDDLMEKVDGEEVSTRVEAERPGPAIG